MIFDNGTAPANVVAYEQTKSIDDKDFEVKLNGDPLYKATYDAINYGTISSITSTQSLYDINTYYENTNNTIIGNLENFSTPGS